MSIIHSSFCRFMKCLLPEYNKSHLCTHHFIVPLASTILFYPLILSIRCSYSQELQLAIRWSSTNPQSAGEAKETPATQLQHRRIAIDRKWAQSPSHNLVHWVKFTKTLSVYMPLTHDVLAWTRVSVPQATRPMFRTLRRCSSAAIHGVRCGSACPRPRSHLSHVTIAATFIAPWSVVGTTGSGTEKRVCTREYPPFVARSCPLARMIRPHCETSP